MREFMIKDGKWSNRFMGSKDKYEDASIIMIGAPLDNTVSFRPGTRYGPQKIREVSYGIEEYSPYLDRDLQDIDFFDFGDLELPFGNLQGSFKMIEEAALEVYKDGKKPLFLGGEHSISAPILKSAFHIYGEDLLLLHFDAHTDLRMDYLGVKESHASVIRRAVEYLPPGNIYQFGVRSGTREEFQFAKDCLHFFPFEIISPLTGIIGELKDRPVYVTFDIDVIDPAFACGTGTPEPGGCTPIEIFDAFTAMKDLNVVGFDIVEVSPVYDPSDRTPVLAAKLVREGMLSFMNTK